MKEKVIWTVKNVLIFAVLYFLSAVAVEGVVIAGFSSQGYDILHGEFPQGYWVDLIPLYGACAFLIFTLIYVKWIAGKPLSDIRFTRNRKTVPHLAAGMAAGGFMAVAAILIPIGTGDCRFAGYQGLDPIIALATLGAFFVQGMAEEVMCRGFLQNFLEKKISGKAAVFIAALAFMAPHLSSLGTDIITVLISVSNLLLVSVLFSLAMVRWNSLWVSIGIHAGWNYFMSYVFGLQLSGMETGNKVFLFETLSDRIWIHGGGYGPEAGIIVTVLLLILDIVIYVTGKERG